MANMIMPAVAPLTRNRRSTRSPTFPFAIQHKPYKLQPFCFIPVQPGETLKNLMWQSRAVSDVINTPLIGAHLEYYWFYCAASQLNDNILDLFVDPDWAGSIPANLATTTQLPLFEYVATSERHVGWLQRMYGLCVGHYFRESFDAWTAESVPADGLYKAQRTRKDVFDSVLAALPATASEDFNVDLNANATITIDEVQQAWEKYERLKAFNLTTMTYEEYLAASGVQIPMQADRRPELIRYTKHWTYPANTVEPTTGVPSSAYSWSVMDRADKKRYFSEPGFILGITVCRPKVYVAAQQASFTQALKNAATWLGPGYEGDILSSYYSMSDTQDLTVHAGTLSVDLRDLWLFGEQFSNIDLRTAATAKLWNGVDCEGAGAAALVGGKYITDASITAMFKTAGQEYIRQDGVVDAEIATHIVDKYPSA